MSQKDTARGPASAGLLSRQSSRGIGAGFAGVKRTSARSGWSASAFANLHLLEAITSTAADGIFMTDEECRVVFVNRAGERMFGFTFEELRGNTLHAMIHPRQPDGCPFSASECPLSCICATGQTTHDHRDTFFRKDGTPVCVSVSNAPLIRKGKSVAAVVIVRDITAEEHARCALAETNERLESALAAAELGAWSANFVTGEVYWDARMKTLFGLAPDERITVAEAETFIHPDDRHLTREVLYPPPECDGEIQWEWRIVRRDGAIRWHRGRGRIHRDQAGRLLSASGVTRDITELKHAQELREHFAAIVESSDYCISSATLEGVVVSWNRGAQAIFGYTPGEIVGRSASILIPPDRAAELEMFLAHVARGEAVEHFVTERLTKDGRRIFVSLTLSPMRNPAGEVIGVAAIARDITHEKLLEEKLRQAEKMEAIGQLAGGIAHDFNNLMTIVNGYASMALAGASDEPLREQLTAIHAAGERATALISQLLAFSRKQMLQLEIVDINSIVHAMLPLLRRVIREDIDCAVELDSALSSVKADRHQIEQVLLNLVVNAGDALSGGGGRILIVTKNVQLDANYSQTHPDALPGKYAALALIDNGPGIDPEIRGRIFEPFFTTKPKGKGAGLGLSMVYGITKQTGGHVTCDSDPAGTRFTVYLPAAEGVAAPAFLPEEPDYETIRGSETILLVEDDLHLRAYAARALRDLGYSVYAAADGKQAIAFAETNPETIDLLVTDMVMPGIGGKELAALLQPVAARMKVLFVSGYTNQTIGENGMGSAFLAKPYTPARLAGKVREVLRTN